MGLSETGAPHNPLPNHLPYLKVLCAGAMPHFETIIWYLWGTLNGSRESVSDEQRCGVDPGVIQRQNSEMMLMLMNG